MTPVPLSRSRTPFLAPGTSLSRALDLPPAPLTGLAALWLLEKCSILLYQYNSISSRNEGGYQTPNTEAPWFVI